ncbi:MAG: hypothetical protein GY820_40875 [Gammaproteobacteria bacterium]|nr:hypothetical protein [Gammaproteobacteria bacterium]
MSTYRRRIVDVLSTISSKFINFALNRVFDDRRRSSTICRRLKYNRRRIVDNVDDSSTIVGKLSTIVDVDI